MIGAGDDRMDAGPGHDLLLGNAGADVFDDDDGRDGVRRFQDNVDILLFDDALRGGGAMTAGEIPPYARNVGPKPESDFGAAIY